jgi:hypothetical protein
MSRVLQIVMIPFDCTHLEWLGDNQPTIFAYTYSVFNEFDIQSLINYCIALKEVLQMGLVGRIIDSNSLIGLISLVGFGIISFVGLISLISLVSLSLNGLIGQINFISLGISFIGLGISYTGLVGLIISFVGRIVGRNGLVNLVDLISLIGGQINYGLGLVGLIGHIGRIGLNGHNDVVGFFTNMEFEIPYYSFVREGRLWCVRRLCSLAKLDSDFFFRHTLQYAKQLFYGRIPQMTKYFVMREYEFKG